MKPINIKKIEEILRTRPRKLIGKKFVLKYKALGGVVNYHKYYSDARLLMEYIRVLESKNYTYETYEVTI